MNLRQLVSCGLVCALALVGCDGGRQTPPKVPVRVVNAAPGFSELGFRREQTQPSALSFKTAQEFSYDADTYDFFVTGVDATGTNQTWPFVATLAGATEYYFVLTEVAGAVVPVVLEHGAAPSGETQILALHAGGGLPAMDLYLERPGAGIAGATPRGTLAPGGQIAARTLPSGDYEVWLTAAGDPATVLLRSTSVPLDAGDTTAFVVTPEGDETTVALNVQFVQEVAVVLRDVNAPVELRVINAATDRQPRDFAINRAFAPPLLPAVPFASPTSYVTVPVSDTLPINVTPPGNPGVLELDQTIQTISSLRYTLLFTGNAGALTHLLAADDRRRLHGIARIRFFSAALQFTDTLEFVLADPGADPVGFFGDAALVAPSFSGYSLVPPGDYDLYARQFTTDEVVAGPIPVTLAGDGVYGVLAVNGPTSTTAEIVLLDDFP
jgi:hypothetical protein